MPVIKSAIKKLKRDTKKAKKNKESNDLLKKALKQARKLPSEKSIRFAVSLLDKAVKNNLLHKNKASRTKSSLSKLIKKPAKKTTDKSSKPSAKIKAKKA